MRNGPGEQKAGSSNSSSKMTVVTAFLAVHINEFVILWLSGEYKKDEILESARSGNEEKMMTLLTPLNVNCHAGDGRKASLVCVITLRAS